jgi:hypothetical protein
MKAKLVIISLLFLSACSNSNKYLVLVTNKEGEYAYTNLKGDTIIPFGKYIICFTDIFKKFAVVQKSNVGFVVINRDEKVLYNVFPFDNGPDYTSEGLFRIVKDGKIGYADSASFAIKIQPQYGCAFPFKNGIAKVSNDCKTVPDGEHTVWVSNNWFYINKAGIKVKN